MLKSKKNGLLIVISSPSGAGKSTIAKKLTAFNSNISLSISLTTREPREGEVNGVDYFFVSQKFFQNKINEGSFLEYAKVFDNWYGTLNKTVVKKIKQGKNILLDIDCQGARQVRKKIPNNVVSIFILPPSISELKKRLLKRERNIFFINRRMSKAKKEIMHWKEYDYAVINDNLNECLKIIKSIISLQKHKPGNQKINKFI